MEKEITAYCPECNAEMKKTRIGGGRRRETAWICPANQKEIYRDERNHIKRVENSKHEYLRIWREHEIPKAENKPKIKSREQIKNEITERERELRGVNVYGFLKANYSAAQRMSSGSHYVYDVRKNTGANYTVRFQLVRLSFLGFPNQYRGVSCNCPRYAERGNCHHQLIAYAEHATSIRQEFDLSLFADFELSIEKQKQLERWAA